MPFTDEPVNVERLDLGTLLDGAVSAEKIADPRLWGGRAGEWTRELPIKFEELDRELSKCRAHFARLYCLAAGIVVLMAVLQLVR